MPTLFRNTSQPLAPLKHSPAPPGHYDIYPCFAIGSGKIEIGFTVLAHRLAHHKTVILDGFGGVLWEHLYKRLDAEFQGIKKKVCWTPVDQALLSEAKIEECVLPFLGGNDPLFGTRFTGSLRNFFDKEALNQLRPDPAADLNILYGCGASLAGWDGFLCYVDTPKNEIHFRSRAGSITNLGMSKPRSAKKMYKRFYFVDWIVFNTHKATLLPDIDLMVDEQRPDTPVLISGDNLRTALGKMSHNFFRVRPWFEPGAWGGQWLKEKIPQLAKEVPNYAWSFELIAPENGLMLESDGHLLEISFDCLMYHDAGAVLGKAFNRFGCEFPIRFDYLDTFGGRNLSLQCHPRPAFIKEQFGENFTQDETYYIFDCKKDAAVYLGFKDDINPNEFRTVLENSFVNSVPVDVERHVNHLPAKKHDLFLIPNGTIHCSGTNNLVLEISATPYIFTFKMYDWMMMDLDGKPRPLNIERAFKNLCFDHKGDRILREFVSQPKVIEQGKDWKVIHLPTHREHFYDVLRYEFDTVIERKTNGACHVMNLVDGGSVMLETANGCKQRFNHAETFVVPAAAGNYRFVNEGSTTARVVTAFVKEEAC